MWKILLSVGVLLSLCSLAGCEAEDLGSLEALSRPYAGVYHCERLLLAGVDVTEDYRLSLELAYGGEMTVSYKTKYGQQDEWSGRYEVDETREEITMSVGEGSRTMSRTYRMEDGAIVVEENFLGRSLYAEFRPE